jgi:hypothetical protein
MVDLTIDTSGIPPNLSETTPLYREDLVGIYNQLMTHINNLKNAIQAFDGVLIGSGTLDASAILQINSTTKTFVPPRMTTTERDAMGVVLQGAIIYNTTLASLQSYDGASWVSYVPVNADEASCRVSHSTTQAIANATPTVLAWNTEDYDTDGMHSTVTNNSRITFVTAGKYIFSSSVKFATSIAASTSARIEILLNGTTVIASQSTAAVGTEAPALNIGDARDFASGDYIEVRVYHNSGGSEDIDNNVSHFVVSKQLD